MLVEIWFVNKKNPLLNSIKMADVTWHANHLLINRILRQSYNSVEMLMKLYD